jgi:hypothetical protein
MKTTATRFTAVLAGVWTGVGALCFETWVRHTGEGNGWLPLVFLVGAVPFFFVPMFVFVFGRSTQQPGALIRGMFQASGRGLCWMAGFLAVLLPGLPLIASLYAS